MITAADVSAIIVTRGDVDLGRIIPTLPYEDVVIWDNSQREDLRTYGRYAAIPEAENDILMFQDDDIVLWDHDALLAAYEPGKIVANMGDAWANNRNYHDACFVGAGAILDKNLPGKAFARYDELGLPKDEVFFYYPDAIVTCCTPFRRVDLHLEVLSWGYAPNRMNAQPWFESRMQESLERGRKVRDSMLAT